MVRFFKSKASCVRRQVLEQRHGINKRHITLCTLRVLHHGSLNREDLGAQVRGSLTEKLLNGLVQQRREPVALFFG